MRNLKRVLALAMAMVLMLGMMVIGASAASYTDAAQIDDDYAEAVNVLSNLGILWGRTDGSLGAKDVLKRSEAAALIYRAITGDVTDSKVDLYDYPVFDDMAKDAWYIGYVTYAANGGYIKGYNEKTFGPDDAVTGIQVLAIMLRAAGYGQNGEYEGAAWKDHVLTDANDLGLLDGISVKTLDTGASRELVAQLLFNSMTKATIVTYTPALGYLPVDIIKGQSWNLGAKTFGLEKTAGVIEAVGRKAGTTTIRVDGALDTVAGTDTPWTDIGYAAYVWTVKTAGAKTRTAVSDVTVTGKSLAVSTNGTDFATLTGTTPKAVAGLDLIDGYDVYYNGVKMVKTSQSNDIDTISKALARIAHKGVKVDFVDNDNSGLAEAVVITEYGVATVIGIANESNTGYNAIVKDTYYFNGHNAVKADNLVCADALAVGNLVTYVDYAGDTYVTVAPAATGTYTQANFSTITRAYESYVIGGVTYELACEGEGDSVCKFQGDKNLLTNLANITNKKSLTVYTDPYGYALKVTNAAVTNNYLYVVRTNHTDNVAGTTYATVAYTDGKVENVYLTKQTSNVFWTAALDMYTYTTKDGNIILGDNCTTSDRDNMFELTNVAYTNGNVNLGATTYLTSTSTVVDLRDVISKRATEGKVYTGFAEVPSLKNADFHIVTDANGFVKVAFLTAGENTADYTKNFVVYHTNAHYFYNDGTTAYYYLDVITDGKIDTVLLTENQYADVCALGVGVYSYDENAALTYTSFEEEWANVMWQDNAIVVGTKGYSYGSDSVNFFTLDIANGKAYPYAMNKGADAMAYVVTKKGVATDIYVVYGTVSAKTEATSAYTKAYEGGAYTYAMEAGKVTNAIENATAKYTVSIDGAFWKEVTEGTVITLPNKTDAMKGTGVKVNGAYAVYGGEYTVTADTTIETGYVKFTVDGTVIPVKDNTTVEIKNLNLKNGGTYVHSDWGTAEDYKKVATDTHNADCDHTITSGFYKVNVTASGKTVTVNGTVETATTFYVTANDRIVVSAAGEADVTYGAEGSPITADITIN